MYDICCFFTVKSASKDRGMSPGPPSNRVQYVHFFVVIIKQSRYQNFILFLNIYFILFLNFTVIC